MAREVRKKPFATTDSKWVLEEEIRRLAYQLYEERGRENGHDIDDWLRAEAELTEAPNGFGDDEKKSVSSRPMFCPVCFTDRIAMLTDGSICCSVCGYRTNESSKPTCANE